MSKNREGLATLTTKWPDGEQRQLCVVVGTTQTKYRVRPLLDHELRFPRGSSGVIKIIFPGTLLVPKSSIEFQEGEAPL